MNDSHPASARYDLLEGDWIENPGASQWRIAGWIRPGSKILDLGCASGRLARYLAEKKQCKVTGVERDPWLAGKARPFCERIHRVDLDTNDPLRTIQGKFDAIVLADILEHLRKPEGLLLACHPRLETGGEILASLPNVANWRIRMALLRGRFAYTETGLLDRTHLRFYTKRSGREMLERSGYTIIEQATTSGRGRRIPALLAAAWPGLFAYQFLYRAGMTDRSTHLI